MIINKLILKNFQLFKEAEINFSKTNLIIGINFDSQELESLYSGNGAGKTSIINAILFCLFGEVSGLNLKDLIRIGEKECSVILQCSVNDEHYIIKRNIPSDLDISINDKKIKFNTQTIAQKWLNELMGEDLNRFRTYRTIDQTKGINLLDLGTISLRKSLMDLINNQFIDIRKNLLTKKLERETYNINKRFYKFSLSQKRIETLNKGLDTIKKEYLKFSKDKDAQQGIINKIKAEIQSREKIIQYKIGEVNKLNGGQCPLLKINCKELSGQLKSVYQTKIKEQDILKEEIKQFKIQLDTELNAFNYYEEILQEIERKERKTRELLLKLKEAFKFSEYKYTQSDVQLYSDSIKTLDSFSAYYVMEWLNNLSVILNDLLKTTNISVEFSIDKEFIKVNNAGQELNYSQLSSGQKTFLNTVFKLGILLNEGISEGLLLIDEGINTCDQISFNKLLEVINNLNFQSIIVYQNIDKSIKDVNYINIERKSGESNVK